MPGVCTCGARLPEDARFCHKCGKPQRDEPLIIEEAPPPPPLPEPSAPRIGFHNGLAVRYALLAGILAFGCSILTGQLALPQEFALLWLIGGGFLAVFLYVRRTGQRLSVASGAHLGWICGIFGFIVVVLALAGIAVMLTDPSVASAMRQQLRVHGIPEASADQMITIFHTPAGISAALVVSFVLFTILPAFGGALGAKLFDRR